VRGIFHHAFIYGLAPVLQKAASLVLLPLYTHYLAPSAYGEVELLTVITGAITVLCELEYRQGYIRALIGADGPERKRDVFSSSLLLLVLSGLAGTLVFLASLTVAGPMLLGRTLGPFYVGVVAIGLFFSIATTILRCTAQAELWSARTVAVEFSVFVIGTLVSAYCIVGLQIGSIGFFIGIAVGSVISFFTFLWFCRRLWTARIGGRETVVPILRFSYPLLASAMLYFVIRYSDRLVIGGMLSVAAVGIYGMTWKLANLLVTFVLIPFQRSFDTWRYRLYEEGGHEELLARTFHQLIMAVAFFAVILNTLVVDLFVALVDARFVDAVLYLPPLSCGIILQAGYTVIASAFFVTGRTGLWLKVFVFGACAEVLGLIVLVPLLELYGAAFATAFANAVLYIGALRSSRALWPVRYRHGPVVLAVAAVALIGAAHSALRPDSFAGKEVADIALVTAYVIFLFATRMVLVGEVVTAGSWLLAKMTRAAGRLSAGA
jgi:O-antigen/teichoic acid export membrane protein